MKGSGKPVAALVIGVGKGKPDSTPDDEDARDDGDEEDNADGGSDEKEEAAQALIDAIKAGDKSGVADAFSTLHAICNEEKY